MRDFKKAFISTISVLLLVIVLSLIVLIPANNMTHNYDWQIRESLAGSLDTLIIGASQGQCAINTQELDKALDCNSYNLSYDSMTNVEKKYLLEKELNRNNVDTVILELSYDTLQRNDITDYTNANVFSLLRMDSFIDRLNYYVKYVNLENKLYVYSCWLCNSIYSMKDAIQNKEVEIKTAVFNNKGSSLRESKDWSLEYTSIRDKYNQGNLSSNNYIEKTISEFEEIIELCKAKSKRVIVVVVPISDNYIWCTDGLNETTEFQRKLCKRHNVEYYNFNLLKDRYVLFSDVDCYSTDICHMSEKGSKIFTKKLGQIIKKSGEDIEISDCFYNNFDDVKTDSPYAKQLDKQK